MLLRYHMLCSAHSFRRLLLFTLLLLITSLASQAEPLYPLLSSTAIDSLRTILRQGKADTNRVKALLLLSNDLISKHEELELALDSAYSYGRQAQRLSNKLGFASGQISSQYVLGRFLQYDNQVATTKALLQQGLARSQQLGARRLAADGWYYLAIAYDRSAEEMPERLRCLQQAAEQYAKLHDRAKEAFVLKTIADMHQVQGNNTLAREELLHVIDLYRSIDYKRLHYTFDLLVSVSIKEGNYKEALQYSFAALKSARATRDTTLLPSLFLRMGSIYKNLKQLDNALAYLQLGLDQAHREKNTFYVLNIANGIASMLITQHKPQEALTILQREIKAFPPADNMNRYTVAMGLMACYTANKQYQLAEKYATDLDRFLQTRQVYPDDYSQHLIAYLKIGRLCVAGQRYAKARLYLGRVQALQAKAGSLENEASTHLLLFKVDSAQGAFPNAIAHYQRYKVLRDSIFSEKQGKQVARLQVQYDTQKREQSISLLKKQTQAQQASLRQREFQRNAVVVGALLLALVLGLVYNRYRLKQRSNGLLEAKQAEINQKNQSLQHLLIEKDWMLKEIHHRVKNNLEVISSLLDTQSNYLRDPAAVTALREGQNRVHAMALIHQKLYQSDNLSLVNMAAYIREITEHLLESFDCQDIVQMQLAVAPIKLEVTLATPLGLILNEALTNALKYAFPHQQSGTVMVELTEVGKGLLQLTIADDGIGFPLGLNLEDNKTMGLTIIRGLSSQLDGTLRISQTPGVRVNIQFAAVPSPVNTEPLFM
jgi:two-component sensor histidine kinase